MVMHAGALLIFYMNYTSRNNSEQKNVAVILSVYKNDNYPLFSECINSLLEQQFHGTFDLWVQFDGKVESEIETYLTAQNKGNIYINKRDKNKGLAKSLNELLQKVLVKNYEYIMRMDADDISMPGRMQKQIEYMEQHADIDCLGTWAIEIDNHGKEYYRKQMPVSHEECLQLFKKRDCLIHPSVMFRRTYFEKAGLYPEDTYFGEDTIMWAKGFKAGCQFANLPEYLLKFRLDDHFFERRRGWKHARSIWSLRCRVNKMLGFGVMSYLYAMMYAVAKLMPKTILNSIYKTFR